MDRVSIQLDDEKRLRNEREAETVLSDSLRKARLEKSTKNRQLEISEFGKLRAMSEEIFELRKLYGELQSSVDQRDLLLDQITSANGKLKAECDVKFRKLDGENRDLVLLLDEAFARICDLEKKTASSSEEISGLKRLLSIRQQMDSETKNNASMDLKERDEYTLKLEEENRVCQDQLRWKNEQFSHLGEAYKKLQSLFNESESECQKEKSSLLHEISKLQSALDARIHASKLMLELENTETLKLMLQKSESEVETLKLKLKTNQQAHEQEKTGLLVTVNEKDAKIGSLEQQISMLKLIILAESETAENLNQEKDNNYVKHSENEIAQLRNNLAEREATRDTLRQENDGMLSSIEEKDDKMQRIQKEYQSATMASLVGKEYTPDEAFKEAKDQKALDVEEKNSLIADMEKETNRLLENSVQVETRGLEELRGELENETRCFENLLEELESHRQALLDGRTKEKINRENLLAQLESMCQLIGFLCTEDAKLMKLSPLYEEESESDELINTFSPSRKYVQVCLSERAPLAELNVSSLSI
ncbi:hypothetical protein AAHA92_30565 [Salvia divinorum]|uniref:Uncharacterized protein n=1 Tax=Salvia divinorum TaxID=28513 RepID=A0ABD1FRD3_SALDI